MDVNNKIKLIAMYFTQYHAIPENDKWWGNGFTDWVNVKKSEPLFPEHNQPRVPLNNNYYDQSEIDTLREQVKLAKKYGIYGFCHYHYWFEGKQLLESPTNIILDNPDLDLPFCLSWANETWSRRWDGENHNILIKQTHHPKKENWQKHFDFLIRAWKDDRAIKIDGKPVFIIYRPQLIDKVDEMVLFWKEQAINAGLKGLYIIHQSAYEIPSIFLREFDAQFLFQPFNSMSRGKEKENGNRLFNYIKKWIYFLSEKNSLTRDLRLYFKEKLQGEHMYDIRTYNDVWMEILKQDVSSCIPSYKGAFVDWDNTARYGKRATIFDGATPQRFEYWLGKLVEKVSADDNSEKLIFINAWNEWAEGAYLEPDTCNQYQYLEAINRVMNRYI